MMQYGHSGDFSRDVSCSNNPAFITLSTSRLRGSARRLRPLFQFEEKNDLSERVNRLMDTKQASSSGHLNRQ